MTRLESALHTLAHAPLDEPATADLADRALTRARQRSRRRGTLGVAAAATVAALVAIGVTTTATSAQQKQNPSVPASTSPVRTQPRVNVLLIGSDGGPERIGVRPDTIIVASIDTRSGDSALFGLPRSLQHAPFPAGSAAGRAWPKGFSCPDAGIGSECLLNGLWHWAEQDGKRFYPGDRHPGLTATRQAAEEITGLSVHETVVVNMPGLVTLVDAVGGVEVNVSQRLPIGGDAADRTATGGWIEKGRQRLTGNQALWYARSRWSTDDFDRMYRQQCLLGALTEQLDAGAMVRAFPKLARTLGRNLSTSIAPDELTGWAELATKVRGAQIHRVGLVPSDRTDPDFTTIRKQVAEVLRGGAPDQARKSTTLPDQRSGPDHDLSWVSSHRC